MSQREALNTWTKHFRLIRSLRKTGKFKKETETNMHRLQTSANGGARSASPLLVNDLCAQLTPLNRYGPTGAGAAIASALRALTGRARPALCTVAGCRD